MSGHAVTGSFTDPSKIEELAAIVEVWRSVLCFLGPASHHKLAAALQVITVEIEHIDVTGLQRVADAGKLVHPAPATLKLIQARLAFAHDLGLRAVCQGCLW